MLHLCAEASGANEEHEDARTCGVASSGDHFDLARYFFLALQRLPERVSSSLLPAIPVAHFPNQSRPMTP